MILTWMLAPLLSMMSSIIGILPDANTTRFGGYGETYSNGVSGQVLGWMHTAGYYVPMSVVVDCMVFLVAFGSAVFVYQLAQWGYRELPTIFGFGPSS